MEVPHKYDMGVIGNCSFIAYVNKNTNIDWLCLPRFDSDFMFGGLLDKKKGGQFSIKPADENLAEYEQAYLENTNILVTICHTPDGSYKVTDFAPRFQQHNRNFRPLMLVRKIEVMHGKPRIKVTCIPGNMRGNRDTATSYGSNHIRFLHLDADVRLSTNIPITYIIDEKEFSLTETKYIFFTYGPPLEAAIDYTAEEFLQKTRQYWNSWVKTTYIVNFYQAQIIRSALALKLHQFEDTGGIIAAGTMSLPESNGSTRNWDYRYCWMRDTYYTLQAFNTIGHFEESEKYFHFIENIVQSEIDRIQPLYGIDCSKKIEEIELDLEGYLGNKPVRVGNDAYTHIQNDVYGQILASITPLFTDLRLIRTNRFSTDIIYKLLSFIDKTMDEKDAGLWEFRHLRQYHCYTFLFHWVGAKSALKIGELYKDEELIEKSKSTIKKAAEMIERCYDPERKVYTQAAGSKYLDASCIQLISMHYLDPSSERARLHLKAIEEDLMVQDGLLFRYKHEDDFGKPEVTFLVCAFWYVDALASVGRIDDAVCAFESLMKYSNHLGLLSEDVGLDGSQWGNFPQTYSHVGLMNSAYRIAKKLDKPSYI
ncbi:glycoside hydrolase family 15 protein [Cytophaga aurantiaca]|uniref:glycoside hydrolase family 15 protein n=1 Tax=Cytophaga aurantiaca TaxID=29530 RepID=UPI00035C4124|nr:glycoside hydrolase family 15 protein [Cytophaga aurantiaca]